MRAPLLLLLSACGDPISNQVLYEDELFLSALPSAERVAPPSEVRLARVGTSAILESAVGEAAAIEGIGTILGGAGDALRDQVPDERTDSVRRWTTPISTAVKITTEQGEQTVIYLVRGDIVQPAGANVLDWTIEAAVEGTNTWIPIATGTHSRNDNEIGQGELTWQIADHAAIIEAVDEVPDHLAITYFDGSETKPRELSIDDETLELGGTWQVGGDNLLIWLGAMTLVTGEAPVVGGVQVFHIADTGGRATGTWITATTGEEEFDICWDANGNDRYVSGVGLPTVGNDADCSFTF